MHDSLRRLRSSDNTTSVSGRSNKHAKLTKMVSKDASEHTHKSSHKMPSKDHANQRPRLHVLASVTSDSTCSIDYREENIIGISSVFPDNPSSDASLQQKDYLVINRIRKTVTSEKVF
ncbi:unnamed protein product [Trichobilharzia regenti]|nr:unnamed protein product [Trichobilharzia regenti]